MSPKPVSPLVCVSGLTTGLRVWGPGCVSWSAAALLALVPRRGACGGSSRCPHGLEPPARPLERGLLGQQSFADRKVNYTLHVGSSKRL